MYNLPKKILHWYDNNKRDLPWRGNFSKKKKQYYTLLSEFMLQQTQVKTVIPFFIKFINRIPNLRILSTSGEKKILKLWEGLGYYRRARNLHKTANILIKKYNGIIPEKFEEIKRLPGVGEYTANALSALIYNKRCIPVDGNVKRVFSRLFLLNKKNKSLDEEIKKTIDTLDGTNRNADFAEALMEFGAIVCKPKNPLCSSCNLNSYCKFFKKAISVIPKKRYSFKEKKFNIYCYLNLRKKEIALTKNNNLGFLNNFKIPKIIMSISNKNLKKKEWNYLCNYKNNISNIKMDIDLFYKFTKKKPKKFMWHSINKQSNEFIPSFTRNIFKKVKKLYL